MAIDYRGQRCLVKDVVPLTCIGQDKLTGKLYFPLPEHLHQLDCGYTDIPSFEVNEDEVRLIEKPYERRAYDKAFPH